MLLRIVLITMALTALQAEECALRLQLLQPRIQQVMVDVDNANWVDMIMHIQSSIKDVHELVQQCKVQDLNLPKEWSQCLNTAQQSFSQLENLLSQRFDLNLIARIVPLVQDLGRMCSYQQSITFEPYKCFEDVVGLMKDGRTIYVEYMAGQLDFPHLLLSMQKVLKDINLSLTDCEQERYYQPRPNLMRTVIKKSFPSIQQCFHDTGYLLQLLQKSIELVESGQINKDNFEVEVQVVLQSIQVMTESCLQRKPRDQNDFQSCFADLFGAFELVDRIQMTEADLNGNYSEVMRDNLLLMQEKLEPVRENCESLVTDECYRAVKDNQKTLKRILKNQENLKLKQFQEILTELQQFKKECSFIRQ